VRTPRAIFLVNYDWFFVSHRLALGEALRDAGFDVAVAALQTGAHEAIERAGLRFHPMPFEPGGRNPAQEARTLAAITALYRNERPDLVHQVTVKAVLYGSLAARALGVPAVVNAISGLGYVFIERPEDRAPQKALRMAVKSTYRVALSNPRSRTIFQNPDDRATFEEARLIRRERTVMIRGSGVDTDRFQATPLPEGPPLAVLPARMLRDKGVEEFVNAARSLRGRFPGARFALVGGVDTQNPAGIPQATLEGWQREGVIEWWGHRKDMPEIFRQAHLVVLPSYREGLPLALAEAASSARACIATDVPGCREVVRHGSTGWLVKARDSGALAEAMAEALGSREELERRGRAGRAMAEAELSRPAVIARTVALYRELLGARWPVS
jgi:glycosyltransferase involved in cell wall biosynthesis